MARKITTTVTGRVLDVEHAGTSVNGNPSYYITIDGPDAGTYRTSSDAACGYSATNYAPRWDKYRTVTLQLTRAGRVSCIIAAADNMRD